MVNMLPNLLDMLRHVIQLGPCGHHAFDIKIWFNPIVKLCFTQGSWCGKEKQLYDYYLN